MNLRSSGEGDNHVCGLGERIGGVKNASIVGTMPSLQLQCGQERRRLANTQGTRTSVRRNRRPEMILIFGHASGFATCWSKAQGPRFTSARGGLFSRCFLRYLCWLAGRNIIRSPKDKVCIPGVGFLSRT